VKESAPLTFAAKGPGVRVDLKKLVESRALVQANSGGGKSWLLRALLEQTSGRVQQFVFDPEGEFHTLRERFDYVLAAKHGGDVEASAHTAALLVRRLMEMNVSAVFDLYDLSKDEKREFLRRALVELMNLPRELWRPVLAVVDEIHDFAPEAGHGEAQSLDAVRDTASRGRKRLVCLVGATQRLGKLSKDVAAELINKFVGRTSLDVDLKRAVSELGMSPKEGGPVLRSLGAGEFYAYGPAISNEVVLVRGPTPITRPPKVGAAAKAPPPAPEKVRAVLAQFADLPKEAEERAQTVEALQKEVRELKRKLKEAPKAKVEIKEVPVLKEKELKRLEKVAERLAAVSSEASAAAQAIVAPLKAFSGHSSSLPLALPRIPVPGEIGRTRAAPMIAQGNNGTVARINHPPSSYVAVDAAGVIGKGERRVLAAVAQHEHGVDRVQLSVLTGYARSSRDTYLQRLRAADLVCERGDAIFVTEKGKAELGSDFTPLPTGDALREYWMRSLPEGERRVLENVAGQWPGEVTRDAVSEATGYARSSRDTYLQRLSARKLVVTSKDGVRASDMLFDGGQ